MSSVRRVLVTGGAGLIGSHVTDALLARGDEVVVVDNLVTGTPANLAQHRDHPRFTFVQADVSAGLPVPGRFDVVMHLASPASPPEYMRLAFETLDVGSVGTRRCLDLAREHGARFVLASTSEVYGDPHVHPQTEDYWGNVNPVGPRSVYDEAKRFAETLTAAYRRYHGVRTGIVRTFNTYGPRLRPADGRVVSNFMAQAIQGRPLTVYGSGAQTRSLCYVSDQVAGYLAMADSEVEGPINIGNPDECTVLEIAHAVLDVTGSSSSIVFEPLPQDDPTRRRPDITRAQEQLGWSPTVPLREGLERLHEWFLVHLDD